jgi:hypothetical protein
LFVIGGVIIKNGGFFLKGFDEGVNLVCFGFGVGQEVVFGFSRYFSFILLVCVMV